MSEKKSNKVLMILLSLIVVVIIAIWLVPDAFVSRSSNESAEPQATAQTAAAESEAPQVDPEIAATTIAKVDTQAPDFTVEMFDGSKVTLSALRGKVVLVNFWATWCPPCREELTHVQKELIDRFAGMDFVFIPISRGETREEVAAFRTKNGYTFPMGLDPEQTVYKKFASNFIPRNFLINRNGQVVAATTGYDADEFKSLVEQIQMTINAR